MMKSLMITAAFATSAFTAALHAAAEETCSYGETVATYGPLNFAVCRGDMPVLKQLVEVQHADVNARDGRGRSPLDVAFGSSTVYWASGFRPSVISYLVAHGADVNAAAYLVKAAVFGETEVVKILLDGGADVNKRNDRGDTALHTAAYCDFRLNFDPRAAATIKLLVSRNADINARNSDGRSVLQAVPTPCESQPALCTPENLPTATWPTGTCKEAYLAVREALDAGR